MRSLGFDFKTVLHKLLLALGTDKPKDTTTGLCDCWQLGYFSHAV